MTWLLLVFIGMLVGSAYWLGANHGRDREIGMWSPLRVNGNTYLVKRIDFTSGRVEIVADDERTIMGERMV